jgi:hypothetical protein
MNSAARLVLWALEAQLDRIVLARFTPDFRELLDAARKRVVAAKIDLDYVAGDEGSVR